MKEQAARALGNMVWKGNATVIQAVMDADCRAKLENVVVVGSNKCVWVQLDSECCEFVSPKDQDPGSYNGD